MAGHYYVSPNEGQGARWRFSTGDLARATTELQPRASVSAPSGPSATVEILVPGPERQHSVLYHSADPVFVFREQDELEETAGLVLRLLQRLAPDVPAVWFADFEGVPHPVQLDSSVDDFIDELVGEG